MLGSWQQEQFEPELELLACARDGASCDAFCGDVCLSIMDEK